MIKFPLIRLKLSNEHIMAVVFMVLMLYQIPQWIEEPLSILGFIGVLMVGFLIDMVLSMRINNTVKCSVSAAITVGIIYALFPGMPFWGGLIGVIVALLLGKFIWGGTGKNPLNPAMVGVVLLSFIFPSGDILFVSHGVIVMAMVLSLPFIVIRPYASIGLMAGMLLSMSVSGTLSISTIISSGMVFWGCLVVTDPVTVTFRPVFGVIGGLIIGFASIQYAEFSVGSVAFIILGFNVISSVYENNRKFNPKGETKKTRISKPYANTIGSIDCSKPTVNEALSLTSINDLTPQEILARIEKNEVLGLGGAGFPTHLKIQSAMASNKKVKTLIINAVECDPGLVHDHWILREHSMEINEGIQAVSRCIPSSKIILATKDISKLSYNSQVEIIKVPDLYPIGAEKKLIQSVLWRNIPWHVVPAEEGILVLNVQTIYAIYEAVCLNKKVESKFITFANLVKNEAQIIKVDLGSKISELIDKLYQGNEPIFVGGGLMQSRRAEDVDVIDKTTNFIAVGQIPRYKEGNCSKCGICVERCPSGLEVYKIADIVDGGLSDKVTKYAPEKCMSCGICSFTCLAGRNLSSKVNVAKELKA